LTLQRPLSSIHNLLRMSVRLKYHRNVLEVIDRLGSHLSEFEYGYDSINYVQFR
jgi:hypothetical protein